MKYEYKPGWEYLEDNIEYWKEETSVFNWDGEFGEVIYSGRWEKVREFLKSAEKLLKDYPSPYLSVCGDGYIHFQWVAPSGNILVIEIGEFSSYLSIDLDVIELIQPEDGLHYIKKVFEEGL